MLKFLSPYWLWVVLALPGVGMAAQLLTSSDPRVIHHLLHPTGEFAARFMIIAMLASPLVLVLKGWRGSQWLKKNRRYFGVAGLCCTNRLEAELPLTPDGFSLESRYAVYQEL